MSSELNPLNSDIMQESTISLGSDSELESEVI